MPLDRFYIAPYNQESGLRTNVKPFLIPDRAFSVCTNAYVWRDRVRKRFGSSWLGNTQLETRLRVSLVPAINTVTTPENIQVGQQFSIGADIFTVNNITPPYPVNLLSTSGVTAQLIAANQVTFSAIAATVYWYPALPVMGLLTYERATINDELTIAFDTRYAYQYISGSGWQRLLLEGQAGAATWSGTDINFFWATTWTGVSAADKIFFVTNNVIADEIRYFNGNTSTWNYANFYYSKGIALPGGAGVGITNGGGNAAGNVGPTKIGVTFTIGNTIFTAVVPNGALAVASLTTAAPVGTGTLNVATGAYTFTAAQPNTQIYFNGGFQIETCSLIVVFKNRLLLLNTTESGVTYQNRVRWSHVASPLFPAAFFEDIPGRGNALDAATTEAIITCEFLKDRLIVYFERSTWELVYTGNQIYPFLLQQINTELGAESTFSIVPFDKVALGVGNVGIHACNGSNVERIDQAIPNAVFEIHNENGGVFRVYGIRDYYVEMVYWTFPDIARDSDFPYPNRVLVYNYVNNTWSFNIDSITAFGYIQPQTSVTWDSTTVTWDNVLSWDSGPLQAKFRQVVAGNQEGYTFLVEADTPTNAPALQITDLSVVNNIVTITAINHNLREDEFVYIESIVGTGNLNLLNNKIYKIINDAANPITANTFSFIYPDSTVVIAGTYQGAGTIARRSKPDIRTKEYNLYANQGRNAMINRVDFMMDKSGYIVESNGQDVPIGQMQAQYYVSTSDTELVDASDSNNTGALLGTSSIDLYPYPTIPYEANASRVWRPVYFQADGEVIQFQITMNDAQMTEVVEVDGGGFTGSSFIDFQLNAICIYSRASSYNFQ